jgi:hypothetical protein
MKRQHTTSPNAEVHLNIIYPSPTYKSVSNECTCEV